MDLEDAGAAAKYPIRDRAAKFPPLFDEILAQAGTQVVLSGIRVSRMNSVMEAPITNPRHIADLDIRRQDRLGGIIHEYQHAA